MWPEVEKAKNENRHELILSGKEITSRINKNGLDPFIYNLTGLNYLSISETSLSEISNSIGNLKNLQTLVLHSNKLQTVNENISKLDKLKFLDLSRNNLRSIPDSFSKLPLETLNLNNNDLEVFPKFTENTKLAILDLANNKLTAFPDICASEMTNFQELKLHGNQIEAIPNQISVLPSLKLLDMTENKLKEVPGEAALCPKLKELMLKSNPLSDRRLLKLVEQKGTKQILEYIKKNCPVTVVTKKPEDASKSKATEVPDETDSDDDNFKCSINVQSYDTDFKIVSLDSVKTVREHIVSCAIKNVTFTEETFKKFIQLQNKLHDNVCDKRKAATIATHDFDKLPKGNLVYTTKAPSDLKIRPLNRTVIISGADLFKKLQADAEKLKKEKKRNTYSGIHKYLYLVEGKPVYPCLINAKEEVISFPPITNSDISKIETTTKNILIEVTSSTSQHVCKTVLNALLKDAALIFGDDLEVQQVRVVDQAEQLKVVYPSQKDLVFDKDVPVKVNRM